ncbi:MAG TPA: hypothetical protein QF528_03125 [Phycisphaerales bacterium]|nr:hypothetical protein [Phycisphaerales bacterium]
MRIKPYFRILRPYISFFLDITKKINTNDPDADINDDGIVNIEDLLLLISAFGTCP